MTLRAYTGAGWLALLGGGEFSFGDTLDADRAWVERLDEGPVGFLPAASGSADYGRHLADYLWQSFDREAVTIPVYRSRDARRGKNVERIRSAAAVYVGGGVPEHLLEALEDSPALEALGEKLGKGGGVVVIAAAAQACGQAVRGITGRELLPGWGWLPGGVVEPNFDPGHDRRLRQLLEQPGVEWGVGVPAGSAVLLGPGDEVTLVGLSFLLEGPEEDLEVLGEGDR